MKTPDQQSFEEKSRLISAFFEQDHAVQTLELFVNEPDFWNTASQWLAQTNNPQADGQQFELSAEKISKIVSLLTAQPVVNECMQGYEAFVLSAHDLLVHGATFAINAQRKIANDLAKARLRIPSKQEIEDLLAEEIESDQLDSDVSALLKEQLKTNNEWVIGPDERSILIASAKDGQFPLALINNEHRFTSPADGSPSVSLRTMGNPADLEFIAALALGENVAKGLLQEWIETLDPDAASIIEKANLDPIKIVSLVIRNNDFKSAFDFNWDVALNSAHEKISLCASRSEPVEEFTQIEDPAVEYRDPEVRQKGESSSEFAL